MSRKLEFVPEINDYEWIRREICADLEYRLTDRKSFTSLGRPLYYRINVQVVITQECPYCCPFCIEKKNPMEGVFYPGEQIKSLVDVLREHPQARLTITGGEPGLYPDHVKELAKIYYENSDGIFLNINTAGYNPELIKYGHVNLSVNDFVKPKVDLFPGCTMQTVIEDESMTLKNLEEIMMKYGNVNNFSFRFMSTTDKKDYNVRIFNEIRENPDFYIKSFRVGDFFTYVTFDWHGNHARITLGDMWQQQHNRYFDGYSNIIIHPDGHISTNWN